MKKNLFYFAFVYILKCNGQFLDKPLNNGLKNIPFVRTQIFDSTFENQHFNIAFTTWDAKESIGLPSTNPSSFQIVDANEPTFPILFTLSDIPKAGERYDFMDFRINKSNTISGYVKLKNKNMNFGQYLVFQLNKDGIYSIVDTFGRNINAIDNHCFSIDDSGQYWFLTNKFHTYDFSKRYSDTTFKNANIITTGIGIWKSSILKTIYELDMWDKNLVPIDSIPTEIIEKEERNGNVAFDITHPNSWLPISNDSGCPLGVLSDLFDGVKFINFCDGKVLRYGASSPSFRPTDSADHKLIMQHDFKIIKEGPFKGYFACFDDGSEEYYCRSARVPILDFNFETKTVRMVDEFTFPNTYTSARGNVSFCGEYMMVNFGVGRNQLFGGEPNWVVINTKTRKKVAEYYLPFPNISYNAWLVKSLNIERPTIVIEKDNTLSIDSTKWSSPLWSNGDRKFTIHPTKNKSYYVTVNGGGIFRITSLPLKLTSTKKTM